MKNLLLLLLLVSALNVSNAQSKKAKAKADKTLNANLQTHIKYLASDELQGRRAGMPGEVLAMNYISNIFEQI